MNRIKEITDSIEKKKQEENSTFAKRVIEDFGYELTKMHNRGWRITKDKVGLAQLSVNDTSVAEIPFYYIAEALSIAEYELEKIQASIYR